MMSHLEDASAPRPGLRQREAVRRRAVAIRRRRRLMALPCVLFGAALIGLLLRFNAPQSDPAVATRGGPQRSATLPDASTTGSPVSTTPDSPSEPSTEISTDPFRLTAPLPPGWTVLQNSGYPLLEGRPAITVSTVDASRPPYSTCDTPLAVMAAMGPRDALVSIVEVPSEFNTSARPPSAGWIPPTEPLQTDDFCPEAHGEPLLSVRVVSDGFSEHGRQFRYTVAIGLGSGQELDAEVRRIVESIEIAA